MTTTTPESRGQIAFTAYGRTVGFKTHDDQDIPAWADLSDTVRAGWIASAQAIWDLATTGKATI